MSEKLPQNQEEPEEQEEQKKQEEVRVPEVIIMDREEKPKKCCNLEDSTKKTLYCCVKSWSLCLNSCEGCCSALSTTCLFFSYLATGCNKCLEQMDCDGN